MKSFQKKSMMFALIMTGCALDMGPDSNGNTDNGGAASSSSSSSSGGQQSSSSAAATSTVASSSAAGSSGAAITSSSASSSSAAASSGSSGGAATSTSASSSGGTADPCGELTFSGECAAGNILRYCVTHEGGAKEVVSIDCDDSNTVCQVTNTQTAWYDCTLPQAPLPDPAITFLGGASQVLGLSTFFISGSTCGEVVGDLPGMNWSSGQFVRDTNGDRYLELDLSSVPVNMYGYNFTYMDRECPGQAVSVRSYAQYGAKEQLRNMTPVARSFLQCNWWNANSGVEVTVSNPSCHFRVVKYISEGSGLPVIAPAGNMWNFN